MRCFKIGELRTKVKNELKAKLYYKDHGWVEGWPADVTTEIDSMSIDDCIKVHLAMREIRFHPPPPEEKAKKRKRYEVEEDDIQQPVVRNVESQAEEQQL
jgi:hypothetical protein